MRKKIISELKKIEERENVEIIYAAESGSRAWGFASPDSDYDVRFIYMRPCKEYLKLNPQRDVIEYVLNDELDINGWDLTKALKLLHSSNPTLFEWLSSPIVYKETDKISPVRAIAQNYFSSEKGVMHYLHMAKGNYREYLKGENVKFKKYFYVIRPILATRHIIATKTPPPMLFTELEAEYLEEDLKGIVSDLIQAKIEQSEKKIVPRIDILNEWIEKQFEILTEESKKVSFDGSLSWDDLNIIFYDLIH